MPRNHSNRSMRSAPVVLVLASLALAACGSSASENAASSSARTTASVAHGAGPSTTTAPAAGVAKATTSKSGAPNAGAAKPKQGKSSAAGSLTAALRACLQQKHVKHCVLPGGGPAAPHVHVASPGVAPAKSPPPVARSTTGAPLGVPTAQPGATPGKDAFEKFAACLRANGVRVQSASGSGASTQSSEEKAAEAKCLVYLDEGS
jgi:hypothetical protein